MNILQNGKFNNHMWKTLKAKGVTPNTPILNKMNALIVKHYVMGFWENNCQQIQYEGVDTLEEAQTIAKPKEESLKGHAFGILQNHTPTSTSMSTPMSRNDYGATHKGNEPIERQFDSSKGTSSFQA